MSDTPVDRNVRVLNSFRNIFLQRWLDVREGNDLRKPPDWDQMEGIWDDAIENYRSAAPYLSVPAYREGPEWVNMETGEKVDVGR